MISFLDGDVFCSMTCVCFHTAPLIQGKLAYKLDLLLMSSKETLLEVISISHTVRRKIISIFHSWACIETISSDMF